MDHTFERVFVTRQSPPQFLSLSPLRVHGIYSFIDSVLPPSSWRCSLFHISSLTVSGGIIGGTNADVVCLRQRMKVPRRLCGLNMTFVLMIILASSLRPSTVPSYLSTSSIVAFSRVSSYTFQILNRLPEQIRNYLALGLSSIRTS